MLAESLSTATSLAWLVFSVGILSTVLLLPTAAWLLRRGLPSDAIAAGAWPGLVALPGLGAPGLQVAMAFALPTLLVVLHARRRAASR